MIESLLIPLIFFSESDEVVSNSLFMNPIVILFVLAEPCSHISSFSHDVIRKNIRKNL